MITLYTILVIFAVLMQAYFAMSEIALTSADRAVVKDLSASGDKRAYETDKLLAKSEVYLGTTLVGTNLAVVVHSVLATRIFIRYFGPDIAPLLTTVCMVPITLLFAEITPKIIGRQFATQISYRLVRSITSFFKFFQPLINSVNFLAKVILLPLRKFRSDPWPSTFTKSDLKRILLMGHETGEVEADEVELIHKVLDLGAKKVRSIMIPLFRISSIEEGETVENLKRLVSLTDFSRIPVYKEKKENLTGIVNIYDILFSMNKVDDNEAVKNFSREYVYVGADDGLDIALARLRHKKRPMGIVKDEDHKILGIVTIEDILEEIVGEI